MEKVYNEDGKVVMVYHQPVPKLVKIGSKSIYFDCQHGISLAFVDEEDVSPLLSVLGGCCGSKRQIIFLATSVQHSHWMYGKGGR